jgi:hypothetical protein
MPLTSDPINLGATGLNLAGLSLVLWHKTSPQAVPVSASTASITVTELSAGDYYFANLPDPSGPFDSYELGISLAGSPAARLQTYRWGFTARVQASDSISSVAAGWQTSAVPCGIKAGSSLPYPAVKVDGLTSNPTGSTATFALTPFGGGTAPTMNGTVRMSVSQAGATWSLQLWYVWDPVDWSETSPAAIAPGLYVGRFAVTPPSPLAAFTAPANDQLRVTVF